jgi:hypothetical protein
MVALGLMPDLRQLKPQTPWLVASDVVLSIPGIERLQNGLSVLGSYVSSPFVNKEVSLSTSFLIFFVLLTPLLNGEINISKGYNQCPISNCGGHIFTAKVRSKISKTLLDGKSVWMCDKESGNHLIRFDSLFAAGEYIFKSGCSTSSTFCIRMRISEVARNVEINTGYGRKSRRTSAYGYKWEIL